MPIRKSPSKGKGAEGAEATTPKPLRESTHYVVTATQARLNDGTYATQGKIVPVEQFGDARDLHLSRGAIRPATVEEVEALGEPDEEAIIGPEAEE